MRPPLAVLIDHVDHLSGGYEVELREAFQLAARRRGYGLLLVAGHALAPKSPPNRLYDFVHARSASALILVSAGLSSQCGSEGLLSFGERFAPLPRVSLGLALPGIPSVVSNQLQGMRDLLEHLLLVHGSERVAFIRGTPGDPDAELRYRQCRELLSASGQGLEPSRVVSGSFTLASGAAATRELLARGVGFDALVCANDGMALGALEVLKAHGLAVPRDVRLTGFDDLVMGRLADPPLATVRQPLAEMAELSVELAVARIEGRPVSPVTEVPVDFLARESCGCGLHGVAANVARSFPPVHDQAELFRSERPWLLRRLGEALGGTSEASRAQLPALVDALAREFEGDAGAFAEALRQSLLVRKDEEAYDELQVLISSLRAALASLGGFPNETLWDQARRQIAQANTRSQARQRVRTEVGYQRIREGGERLFSVLDRESLARVVAQELRALEVGTAFISLLDPSGTLLPFAVLRQNKLLSVDQVSLAGELLPNELLCDQGAWLCLPLSSQEQFFGVAVFELPGEASLLELLRSNISVALRLCWLHGRLVERSAQHERMHAAGQATAKRMQALGALAGGVAHELNNALGPLVALTQLVEERVRELSRQFGQDETDCLDDLSTIRGAAARAARTVRDLLSLSRQEKSERGAVDLNRMLADTLRDPSVREALQQGNVELSWVEPSEALWVSAAEPLLSQAIAKLLLQSCRAMRGGGSIRLSAGRAALSEPLSGFELVPAGDYVVLRVTDSGVPIAASDVPHLFEPFSASRRGAVPDDGLGLAVVHAVIKEHGGFIDVESQASGVAFSVYLARLTTSREAHIEVLGRPTSTSRARILVVDDEPLQLRTAQRILSRTGYDVVTSQSGIAAFELFRGQAAPAPFDLVVLDMLLNESWDGLQLLERIRSLFPQQAALIVSGHAPNDRGSHARRLKVRWLTKPYTVEVLSEAVRSVLETRGAV